MEADLMMTDWDAWQRLARHWHEHSGDINADNILVRAIRHWGEELVALRLTQPPEVRERARGMARTDVQGIE
jgi:hypothetical protein